MCISLTELVRYTISSKRPLRSQVAEHVDVVPCAVVGLAGDFGGKISTERIIWLCREAEQKVRVQKAHKKVKLTNNN